MQKYSPALLDWICVLQEEEKMSRQKYFCSYNTITIALIAQLTIKS